MRNRDWIRNGGSGLSFWDTADEVYWNLRGESDDATKGFWWNFTQRKAGVLGWREPLQDNCLAAVGAALYTLAMRNT
jgi:hypothetical protein